MEQSKNTIRISEKGKLVIQTDNATCIDNDVITDIHGRTFEISGSDVLVLQKLFKEKKVSCITVERGFNIHTYIFVGENAENKEIVERNIKLEAAIEKFNNTRHWWERKI